MATIEFDVHDYLDEATLERLLEEVEVRVAQAMQRPPSSSIPRFSQDHRDRILALAARTAAGLGCSGSPLQHVREELEAAWRFNDERTFLRAMAVLEDMENPAAAEERRRRKVDLFQQMLALRSLTRAIA